jgi:hypothetical protein
MLKLVLPLPRPVFAYKRRGLGEHWKRQARMARHMIGGRR